MRSNSIHPAEAELTSGGDIVAGSAAPHLGDAARLGPIRARSWMATATQVAAALLFGAACTGGGD